MSSLDPKKWQRAKEIFRAVLQLEGKERDRFLDQQCGNDDDLRSEVLSLLDSSHDAGSFMKDDVATAFLANTDPIHPGKTFGHYTVKKALGKGGMGEVYLATDNKLRREVAVKVLPPELTGNKD